MSTPYLGEIRTVGFNFPPVGWVTCNGQLLNISQNEALYALIGTTYGGDGVNTFGVPNLQSRVNVAAGTGPGLSNYPPGQMGGTENVTLTTAQIPTHSHPFTATLNASLAGTVTKNPVGNVYPSASPASLNVYGNTPSSDTLAAGAITGMAAANNGGQPHANIQPVLALNCIMCTEGIFPPKP